MSHLFSLTCDTLPTKNLVLRRSDARKVTRQHGQVSTHTTVKSQARAHIRNQVFAVKLVSAPLIKRQLPTTNSFIASDEWKCSRGWAKFTCALSGGIQTNKRKERKAEWRLPQARARSTGEKREGWRGRALADRSFLDGDYMCWRAREQTTNWACGERIRSPLVGLRGSLKSTTSGGKCIFLTLRFCHIMPCKKEPNCPKGNVGLPVKTQTCKSSPSQNQQVTPLTGLYQLHESAQPTKEEGMRVLSSSSLSVGFVPRLHFYQAQRGRDGIFRWAGVTAPVSPNAVCVCVCVWVCVWNSTASLPSQLLTS